MAEQATERQTWVVPPRQRWWVHETWVAPDQALAMAHTYASCRSERPQPLCSCGRFWLEWT